MLTTILKSYACQNYDPPVLADIILHQTTPYKGKIYQSLAHLFKILTEP